MRNVGWMILAVVAGTATAGAGEAKPAKAQKPAAESKAPESKEVKAAREAEAKAAAQKAAEEAQVVRTFAAGTPEAVLRDILHCGADIADEAAAFDCWVKLHMTTNRDTETAVTQLKHYSWKVFRSRADSYAVKPMATTDKDFAIRIAHREPEKCDAAAKECKFFLVSRVRDMPAPVTLRLEDGQWRIYSISL